MYSMMAMAGALSALPGGVSMLQCGKFRGRACRCRLRRRGVVHARIPAGRRHSESPRGRRTDPRPKHTLFLAAALGLLAGTLTPQADARIAPRPTGVIGVDSNQLTPEYWIDRQRHADRVVLDRGAIALQNRELQQTDPSMHDVESLPAELDARSEEHTSELQSLMRISYAVFCLTKKKSNNQTK